MTSSITDTKKNLITDTKKNLKNTSIGPVAVVRVHNPNFWSRIYTRHDLGLAEAYMHGDFLATPDEAKALLDLWIANRKNLDSLWSVSSWTMHRLSALYNFFFGQSLSNAKLNVITGYDVDNQFFYKLLGSTVQYSSALWPDHIGGGVRGDLDGLSTSASKNPDDTTKSQWSPQDLDDAQVFKLKTVLGKVRVRPGDRVLEFGTGWGSLAIEAAKMGCTVDTLTLSKEQRAGAVERIRKLGLQDKITVHLLDYRNLPREFEAKFDAFVSMEMVEHAGAKWLPTYFKIVDWALKPDRAAAFISATCTPDWRFTLYQYALFPPHSFIHSFTHLITEDYARKYHWPNTFCPSPTYLATVAAQSWPKKMALESIEDCSEHYPRTLREWARRLQSNWGPEMTKSLIERHPELANPESLAIFKRKWEYLFFYAEVGYARAYTHYTHFTFVRPENPRVLCD
ncbi:CFS1-like protein [Irpex rosettiformis]|uniref:CFS1-like protein n=1 Tax=Irpex rosettiformis TaxID=378272 RepID=A0ACB8UIT2_9APHY|nr:CFS1-like protein [Irpex rosettiformis]